MSVTDLLVAAEKRIDNLTDTIIELREELDEARKVLEKIRDTTRWEVNAEKLADDFLKRDHINSAVKHIGDVDDMPPLVDFLMHPEDN